LPSEELDNLYSSSNIIRQIKSRRMRGGGRARGTHGSGEKMFRLLVGKLEGKKLL
jgi:hypothetical protein